MSNHFVERLNERYDTDLTEDDVKRMRKLVTRGDSVYLRNSRDDRTVRTLVYKDHKYWFVWNHRNADFVTFFPEGGEDARNG